MQLRSLMILTALALATAQPALALPCTLTDNDWASLAHPACTAKDTSCGPVSEATADTLAPERQADICKGRKYYNFIHEHLARGESAENIAKLPEGADYPYLLSRYITKDEYTEIREVVSWAVANSMSQ